MCGQKAASACRHAKPPADLSVRGQSPHYIYENLLKNNALVLPLMQPRPLRLHTRGEIREGGFTDAIRHLLRQQQMLDE